MGEKITFLELMTRIEGEGKLPRKIAVHGSVYELSGTGTVLNGQPLYDYKGTEQAWYHDLLMHVSEEFIVSELLTLKQFEVIEE